MDETEIRKLLIKIAPGKVGMINGIKVMRFSDCPQYWTLYEEVAQAWSLDRMAEYLADRPNQGYTTAK